MALRPPSPPRSFRPPLSRPPVLLPSTGRTRAGLALVLILFPLVLLPACGGSGGAEAVSRTTVGDTLFVVSRRPAVDPGPLFTVERELSIGVAEGEETYQFLGIDAVSADEQGCIYVSDQREGEVRVFAPDGTFLFRFGRRGSGPGEFDSNYWGWFRVAPHGEYLTVEDLPRLRVFDRQGVFERSINLQPFGLLQRRTGSALGPIHWFPEQGRLLFPWLDRSEFAVQLGQQSASYRLVLADDEMTEETMADVRWLPTVQEPNAFFGDGERGLSIPFTAAFVWALSGDRWVTWGIGDRIRLTRYDLETDDWLVSEVPTEPEPVTAEDISGFKTDFLERPGMTPDQVGLWEPLLNRMPFPDHKPVMEEVVGDDQGRFWVRRTSTASWAGEEGDEVYRYDLIAPDGVYLGYVELPRRIGSIRDGFLYTTGTEAWPTAERWRLIPR